MPISPASNHHRRRLSWIAPFIRALSEGMCAKEAARIAGTSVGNAYNHRAVDEDFRACWNRAVERGTELLEHEAVRRAYHGVGRPVFYRGEKCGMVQDYSDTLLMFLLRARRPEVYREGVEDGTMRGASVINVNIVAVDGKPQPKLVDSVDAPVQVFPQGEQGGAVFQLPIEVVSGSDGEQDREGVQQATAVPAK